MSRFKLWLEERESERKVRRTFLSKLGFSPDAMEDSTVGAILIKSYKDKIIKALESMDLEESKFKFLKNWVMNHSESSIQDLINQINPDDVGLEPSAIPPGKDAELPKGSESLDDADEKTKERKKEISNPPLGSSMPPTQIGV
jgi:hypothetical protein